MNLKTKLCQTCRQPKYFWEKVEKRIIQYKLKGDFPKSKLTMCNKCFLAVKIALKIK